MARRDGVKNRRTRREEDSPSASEELRSESSANRGRLRSEIVVVSTAVASAGMRTSTRLQRRKRLSEGSRGEKVTVRVRKSERRRLRSRLYFDRRCALALAKRTF